MVPHRLNEYLESSERNVRECADWEDFLQPSAFPIPAQWHCMRVGIPDYQSVDAGGALAFNREFLELRLKVAALEVEVSMLRASVQQSNESESPRAQNDPRLLDLIALTQDLFACVPTAEVLTDPEEPGFPFVVLTASWDGEPREVIRRRLEWHDRVRCLAPGDSGKIRLFIVSK